MPQIGADPRDPADGRRVRAGAAPLPDRLLGRRQPGAARADGPQRRRQRLPRRGRPAARPSLYIPAYIRRYPFLLARLRPDSDELSLCFDPTAGAVGEFDEGEPLFDGDQPSEATKAILQFCEQFEAAGQRTAAFMEELKSGPADGRRSRDPARRLRRSRSSIAASAWSTRRSCANLRGDELRKMNQSGMLPLIYAHLFSLIADARRVRPADAAGQGARSRCRSRPRRPPKALLGGGRVTGGRAALRRARRPALRSSAATRSKPVPGSLERAHRDSSGGRSRAGARGHRAPGGRGARSHGRRRRDR